MLTNNSGSGQSYHHGNLKEALVDTALELIEGDAIAEISLRKLSRKVGITPSAVYNHFADKDALLLAIKTRIYGELNDYFAARCSDTDDPEQSLLEMCLAYYYFSKDFPSHFSFLFSSTLPLEWSTPKTVEVSCHCIRRVRNLVWRIYQKYQISCSETEVVNATLLVWSQLQGMVALRNSGSIKAAVSFLDWPTECALTRNAEVEQLIRTHVAIIVNGIQSNRHLEAQH